MILTVCMSPCIDVNIELNSLNVGKTNVLKSKSLSYGGKALNVAIGAKRLGEEVFVTGVNYTENGFAFEKTLSDEGVRFDFARAQGRARENYKFIDQRSMLTEVNDVGAEVPSQVLKEVLEKIRVLSKKASVVVLSGSLPRGVEATFYSEMVRAIDDRCIKIVDASGQKMVEALKEGVDLVKPNVQELENTLGMRINSKRSIIDGCRELIGRGAKNVLLSLGEEGAVITNGRDFFQAKTINVAVNSTVGAGDAMVAAVAIKMQKGAPLPEMLRAGVAAGTARVSTFEKTSFSVDKYEEIYKTVKINEYF